MSQNNPTNIAASFRQKILDKARRDKRPFSELLQYYAMERFLYRLSISEYSNKFILKGGLLFRIWEVNTFRPTMDIDMLGKTENAEENIAKSVKKILLITVEEDGIVFDPNSIVTERITENADYEGIRVRFRGLLDKARLLIQLDIGFGDIVYPMPSKANLNTVLKDSKSPKLYCYSKESCIAEKLETMIKLQEINSRMKDFYDIWILINKYNLNVDKLTKAISKTFHQRETVIPETIIAFTKEFAEEKQAQWNAFLSKQNLSDIPERLWNVIGQIRDFFNPILSNVRINMDI